MTDRKQLGQKGETLARDLLLREGYRVLETNFATRFGELDIVAEEGEVLCFVEVRLRSGRAFGLAQESLTATKRRHLLKAAQIYLTVHRRHESNCRFDLLALDWDRDRDCLRSHTLIRNAFGEEG